MNLATCGSGSGGDAAADDVIWQVPTGGRTAIYWAAVNGHPPVAMALLESNADPDQATTDDRQTPVFAAARDGHVDVVKVLLAQSANPNQACTDDGQTPMYINCRTA